MNNQVVSLLFFAAPLGLPAGPGVPRSDARLSPDQAVRSSIVEHDRIQDEQQFYYGAMKYYYFMGIGTVRGDAASMVLDVRALFIERCQHSGARTAITVMATATHFHGTI